LPRPEGRRCLVISSQQMTISRHRNGSILHRFPSILPNGSRASMAGSGDDFCILDCIFHEPNSTYYILDMMCWKGYALYDCSAEFRLFWVQGKLAECASGSAQDQARYPFVPVPAYTCSPGDMLAKVYACTAPAILFHFAVQRLHLIVVHRFGSLLVWCYMQRDCSKPIQHQRHFSETAYTCCIRKATTACQAHHWPCYGKTAHAASTL
jgi:hypothetical protein